MDFNSNGIFSAIGALMFILLAFSRSDFELQAASNSNKKAETDLIFINFMVNIFTKLKL
jgi:hypothetical protein